MIVPAGPVVAAPGIDLLLDPVAEAARFDRARLAAEALNIAQLNLMSPSLVMMGLFGSSSAQSVTFPIFPLRTKGCWRIGVSKTIGREQNRAPVGIYPFWWLFTM